MTREEMMAKGLVPEETKHNGHRRAHFHDYNRPGVYMITLVTEGRRRVFGRIVGHTRGARGTEEYPHLQCSALGARVLEEEMGKIPQFYPMVEVCKVALMPDHIHLLTTIPPTTAIADFMHDLKIATSNFIKNNKDKFPEFIGWGASYGVFTVSESEKQTIYNYILRQKEHHQKVSFKDEYMQFLKENGIDYEERFIK